MARAMGRLSNWFSFGPPASCSSTPHLSFPAEFFEAGIACALVPLCGKTLDLRDLSSSGFEVLRCELSPLAAQQFFDETGGSVAPLEAEGLTIYKSSKSNEYAETNSDERGSDISILVGDFFTLPLERFGLFELIWDRAALVALPPRIQMDNVEKLRSLFEPNGRLILVNREYDSTKIDGPPFSVTPDIVRDLYGSEIQEIFWEEQIEQESAPSSFVASGIQSFIERTWLWDPKS